MQYALTAAQMRGVEDAAVASGLVTLDELMARAGSAVAGTVASRVPEGPVVVVCGPGNNGGDGWVAAQRLTESGRECRVITAVAPAELKAEAGRAAAGAIAAGVSWEPASEPWRAALASAASIIDAVFGFGFHGVARDPYADLLRAITASSAFVVAVDVPSGVDADTGAVEGPAARADVTVTFTAPKRGLVLYPGASWAGDIAVAEIGIPLPGESVAGALELPAPVDLAPVFPWPMPQDHKGSRGRVAIVAGSSTYPGTAVLAARGAARLGVGFTVAVVPEPIGDIVRSAGPNWLVRAMPADENGAFADTEAVLGAVADADAIVVGPGLTTTGAIPDLVRALVERTCVPLVLDADALNAFPSVVTSRAPRSAPVMITPHPGEAARLLGITNEAVQADRVAASAALCGEGMVCLLKGARTMVAGEGRQAVIMAGNEGLARAGSGDVLAGMLGALLAQKVGAYDAAVLGATLHGRAADHGVRYLTTTCFTSADITDFLPDAVREVAGE
jgi:NAD(P)H-hydrate epimerase